METKRWYESKTIWGIALTAVVGVASALGIQPVEEIPEWVTLALELLGLVIATIGRFSATKAIR